MIKKLTAAFLIWLLGGWPTIVFALPSGGKIVSGQGSIVETSTTQLDINQLSPQMITTFNNFDTAINESVYVNQVNTSDVLLVKVLSSDPTIYLGKLIADGQVLITNGSGVFFGPGSQVDVHGLIATTMDISNQDFLDRNYKFTQNLNNPLSSVINEGVISATSYVGLLAPAVENRKDIVVTASLGSIDLASGTAATLDFTGDGLIQFQVTQEVSGTVLDKDGNELEDRVSNTGLLDADGGQVRMSAKDAGDVIRHVVNMEGTIKANSVVEKDGKVFLMGGDSGVVNVSGTIDASGDHAGEKGGTVQVTGEYVGLFDNAKVDVSGDAGGGTALIGGDYQGKNPTVQNAFRTYVSEDAVIDASAKTTGDGGKAIVWADETTRFYGSVKATAGSLSGDGGFIEISGKENLHFRGEVDASSIYGVAGTVLFDPKNITVSNGGPDTLMIGTNGAFNEVSSTSITFDADDITAITNTGTAIILQANNDITINEAITTVNGGGAGGDITLQAGRSVLINANITTDDGALTIVANEIIGNGVQDGDRDAGAAVITMADGVTLNAGSGNISLTLDEGPTTNNSNGNITVENLTTTGHVFIALKGNSDGGSLLRASSDSLIDAASLAIDHFTAVGMSGSIGTSAAPLRIKVNNIDAHTHYGTSSIYIKALQTLIIGGSTLGSGFGVKGVQTASDVSALGGDIEIDVTGSLSTASGGAGLITADKNGKVTITTTGTIAINDTLTADGNLTFSAGGNITQGSALVVSGNSSITTSGGSLITLNNGSNAFTGSVSLNSTGAVTLTNTLATTLAASSLGSTLLVTSSGAITQSGALAVTGTSTFTTTASNSSITLTNSSNDFTGALSFSPNGSGSVQLTDSTNTILAASTFSGMLTVISSGNITQTGALAISGGSSFTVSGSHAMTLTNASNSLGTGVTISAGTGAVQLTNNTATTLTSVTTTGGSFTLLTTTGGITLADNAISTGSGSVALTSSAGSITEASSNMTANITTTGAVSLTAGTSIGTFNTDEEVDLASSTQLTLDVNENFFVKTAATLTDLGITVDPGQTCGGSCTYSLTANNLTLTLMDSGTNLTLGGVTQSGSNLNFGLSTDTGNIAITGGISIGTGNLSLVSGGNITQSTALSLAGTSSFVVSGAHAVTLTTAGNDFMGSVLLSTGTVLSEITDTNALEIGTFNIGTGGLAIIAGGAVTQTGTITSTTAGLSISTTGAVTLENTFNDVNTLAIFTSSGNVSFVDANGFTLASLNSVDGIRATAGSVTLRSVTGGITVADVRAGNDLDASTGISVTLSGDDALLTMGSTAAMGTTTGDIKLTADKMILDGMVNAPGQRVILKSNEADNFINLGSTGDSTANTLELSNAELNNITANYLEIGSTLQGAIDVSSDVSLSGVMFHLISGSGITGTTGGIVVANLAMEAGGDVNFTDTTTDVDQLAISASGFDVTFYDADALDINTVDGVVGVKAKTFTHSGPGPLTATEAILLDGEVVEEVVLSSPGDPGIPPNPVDQFVDNVKPDGC